jgi:hypothetical protein
VYRPKIKIPQDIGNAEKPSVLVTTSPGFPRPYGYEGVAHLLQAKGQLPMQKVVDICQPGDGID